MIGAFPGIKKFLPKGNNPQDRFRSQVISDFWICLVSRAVSILARREVLTGKAKFGVTGDGKEVAQIAMARALQPGDYFAPYYRGQTYMFAKGLCSVEDYFAQLYADSKHDPFSNGRQMNNHFATPFIDKDGDFQPLAKMDNVTACVSSTAGPTARSLGIAFASKKFRESDLSDLDQFKNLSRNGNEVCLSTIGDGSTSEGVFWETMNAACVLQVPLVTVVMDDGFGISVPVELQTTKGSISEAVQGFLTNEEGTGMWIEKVKGWDYAGLCALLEQTVNQVREKHMPALIHVTELTQPQGHSSSGSHERYKSKERLSWEKEYDCIEKMAQWMIANDLLDFETREELEQLSKTYVKERRSIAWKKSREPIQHLLGEAMDVYSNIDSASRELPAIQNLLLEAKEFVNPHASEIVQNLRRLEIELSGEQKATTSINEVITNVKRQKQEQLQTNLYSNTSKSALKIAVVPPVYTDESERIVGFKILNRFFKEAFAKYPHLFAFGEDVGFIGDVNQGFAGLQKLYGEERIFDCGIREWTIMGQAIGMAMRGLRPIGEIQYLDYIYYGLATLVDDLSTLRYRSNGIQAAPVIIRTRGHRLEGIWHTGSHMGTLLHSLRGLYVLTPRNMVQAAGMYNTMLQSDDPAIIVESLNGYRIKETLPDNIGEYTVPLGVPEIISEGSDVTIVTYGSCVRIAEEAVSLLERKSINAELIDVQTLLPFDLESTIAESLKKTNRILFVDEDVPGAASAYMMQQVLEVQGAYKYLDSAPLSLTAKEHRTPYGTDGDYFCKPSAEDIYDAVLKIMMEVDPAINA